MLHAVWEQIVGKIENKGQSEFEQICKERSVVPGLNALETLIGEARGRKEAGIDGEGTAYVLTSSLALSTVHAHCFLSNHLLTMSHPQATRTPPSRPPRRAPRAAPTSHSSPAAGLEWGLVGD